MGLVEEIIPNGIENDENMHEAANANFVGDKEEEIPIKSNPKSLINKSAALRTSIHITWLGI